MKNTRNEKVLWADPEFIRKLEEIQAKRILKNKPKTKLGMLTKEMLNCPSFNNIEKELLEEEDKTFKIAMDKKRLLK